MNPFTSYSDMKNKYPIQVIDLRFQVDHISPKKIQLFEELILIPSLLMLDYSSYYSDVEKLKSYQMVIK